MSKQSAPRIWISAVSVVAVAIVAVAVIAGSNHLQTQRKSSAAQPAQVPANAAQRAAARASLDTLPLAFEANQGQTDPQVKYMARGNGYTAFLTADETVFAIHSVRPASPQRSDQESFAGSLKARTARQVETVGVRMKLVGANPNPRIIAAEELPGHSNYFIGNDPSKWQSAVNRYRKVSYSEVYPGVNLTFHGEQRLLEFDFLVAPRANAESIRFNVSGAKQVSTDASGNLVLSSAIGDVVLHKPVAYQKKNNTQEPVDSRFIVANNSVGFELGSYDHSRELIIDPSVTYATYLGGSAEDDAYGIAIDGSGSAYVTGQTASSNFPVVSGDYSTTYKAGFDVFVSKLSADGTTLEYSTYVGGSADDSGNAIALDASGNAYIAGGTKSADFPVSTGAFQKTIASAGVVDAFVFELASNGGALIFSTYLGGTSSDVATSVAVDTTGVYVGGSTSSADFPKTTGAFQTVLVGSANGFITKLNSSGSSELYSTFLGAGGESLSAIAVDSSGNAYVTGSAVNAAFPTTSGVFQKNCSSCGGGISDAFVSVVKADGSTLLYSTFLGGSGLDQGFGIALDGAGDAYVTGVTQSTNFPVQPSPPLRSFGGTQNAFVTELNPTGTALVYSTYLGGSNSDLGAAIAVDSNKNAYVTGETNSANFPTVNPTQATLKGGTDAFVSEISASGSSLVFSTFLGGSQNEDLSAAGNLTGIGAIAVDSAGANVYVAGSTTSSDFPVTTGVKQGTYRGAGDAFVAKYATGTSSASFTITNGALSPTSGSPGISASATITVTSVNGFNSAVQLACAVSPVVSKGPTCSFSNPAGGQVTPAANGTATATLNVATAAAAARLEGPAGRNSGIFLATIVPLFGITLLGAASGSTDSRSRRLLGFALLGVIMMSLLLIPGCSSSSTTIGGGGTGTPAGSYTITVTGTSGGASVTGSPALTLTVN